MLEMSRNALKEKIVRVCLATLRNMLTKSPETNTLPLYAIHLFSVFLLAHHSWWMLIRIGFKLLPLLETFQQRKWSDDEIKEDIQFLHVELTRCINNLRFAYSK